TVAEMSSGLDTGMDSLSLNDTRPVEKDIAEHPAIESTLLINCDEELQCSSADELCQRLNCRPDTPVKVVSIFGKTGDGKSHTLNHAFFDGRPVFATSARPESCTVGVWAALDSQSRALVLDTEGLQGETSNENQRTRLLLKILAISDIILYRIKADRLQNDMFLFLGDASRSYTEHFKDELVKAIPKEDSGNIAPLSRFGLKAIVFHETHHTETLAGGDQDLRDRFERLNSTGKSCAYAKLIYVGIRSSPGQPTNFEPLRKRLHRALHSNEIRSPRPIRVIYGMLRALNEKFSGQISDLRRSVFPDEYFTCGSRCVCCQAKCTLSMNHGSAGGRGHLAPPDSNCRYTAERDNKVFLCETCYLRGQRNDVAYQLSGRGESGLFGLAKYAWSGYVLECPTCGVIYRSRQHWYGNEDPERAKVVRSEVRHVWDDADVVPGAEGSLNAAQRLLDGVNFAVSSVSAALPTQVITDYISDSIAPSNWVPNSQIEKCHRCGLSFLEEPDMDKHHCRSCGQGFCHRCSNYRAHVSGYGSDKVRVCETCYSSSGSAPASVVANDTKLRQYTELLTSACGSVYSSTAGAIKSFARPSYWQRDDDISQCSCCEKPFHSKRSIHHCRRCGMGVCDPCSPKRQPVPARGWDIEVRVCNKCYQKA
ncbi:hypothetical protein BOX15_Mlig026800g3, partial [Macrostomum lignano]